MAFEKACNRRITLKVTQRRWDWDWCNTWALRRKQCYQIIQYSLTLDSFFNAWSLSAYSPSKLTWWSWPPGAATTYDYMLRETPGYGSGTNVANWGIPQLQICLRTLNGFVINVINQLGPYTHALRKDEISFRTIAVLVSTLKFMLWLTECALPSLGRSKKFCLETIACVGICASINVNPCIFFRLS